MTRRAALFALFGGLAALVVASRLLIFNTAAVAEALEVPEFVIGLVIIGPGTSLPEIAAAIQSVRRSHADLVLGIYRPDAYKRQSMTETTEAEILFLKQRNGPAGPDIVARINFNGPYARFGNIRQRREV